MPILVRMAFRNIWEHKAKSLIIGVIICIGTLVIIVGNSLMDASKEGIQTSFIDNYTGDVMIHAASKEKISLFGVQSVGAMEATPDIPDYDKVREIAASVQGLRGITSMASGFGTISIEGLEPVEDASDEKEPGPPFVFLFGVEPQTYFKLFGGLRIVEGTALKTGAPGILLSRDRMEKIGKKFGRSLTIGDKLLINGFGATGMRIREVPIVGVFEKVAKDSGPEQLAYVDIDTIRVLTNMTVGTVEETVLDASSKALLAGDADPFAGGLFAQDSGAVASKSGAPVSIQDLSAIFSDSSAREAANTADNGAWHSILLRLDDSDRAPTVIADLNRRFADAGLEVQAVSWKDAAGPYGSSIDVIRIVFNTAISIVAIVAIIIIMNTLMISVIERTGEIGTMRALGAQKGFVWQLFAGETLALTVVFGLIGTALSLVAIGILNALHIQATNPFLEILFGGPVLRAAINPFSILSTLIMVLVVSFLAHLYPVSVALKVPPVRAMQTE